MNMLARWNPFRELEAMQNRMSTLWGRSLLAPNGEETITATEWSPLVDVIEDDKEYLVKAELPEVKKEDVKVTLEDGALHISGERKFEKEEKNRNTIGSSAPTARSSGFSFCRGHEARCDQGLVSRRPAGGASPQERRSETRSPRGQGLLTPRGLVLHRGARRRFQVLNRCREQRREPGAASWTLRRGADFM